MLCDVGLERLRVRVEVVGVLKQCIAVTDERWQGGGGGGGGGRGKHNLTLLLFPLLFPPQ